MAYRKVENEVFEGARIVFRNFGGEKGKYNQNGNRNFCVVIEDQQRAERMIAQGWNVKQFRPRDDEEEPKYYIQITVEFDYYPPSVYLICGNKREALTEDNISILDHAEIKNVDMVIRPYCWEVNDKSGIKGYLKSMYVTIEEDVLAKKYASYDGSQSPEEEDDLPWG